MNEIDVYCTTCDDITQHNLEEIEPAKYEWVCTICNSINPITLTQYEI